MAIAAFLFTTLIFVGGCAFMLALGISDSFGRKWGDTARGIASSRNENLKRAW